MPHTSTLEHRHSALDKSIAARLKNALSHDFEVVTLKKKKLALKDQLQKS